MICVVQVRAAIEEHHRMCMPCCVTEVAHPRAIEGGQVELKKWRCSADDGWGDVHTAAGTTSSRFIITCTVYSSVNSDQRVSVSCSSIMHVDFSLCMMYAESVLNVLRVTCVSDHTAPKDEVHVDAFTFPGYYFLQNQWLPFAFSDCQKKRKLKHT